MTDQQPVEGTPATPEAAPGTEQPAGSPPVPPTAQQIESEYKARLSGKDKAHAAETATLQAQIDALKGVSSDATSQAKAASTDVETLQKQLADAQKTNTTQQQEYQQSIRSAKYPYAAESLDPQTLATMDEAKLAGLDARLKPSATPTPGVASSTPARDSAPDKSRDDKTIDELKADLAKFGPQFSQELSQRGR